MKVKERIEFDLLGSIINKCLCLIKKNHGVDIDIDMLPTDDPLVYELINTDTSLDVFGLDAPEYHELISRMSPTEFRHLAAIHSMYSQWMREKYSFYIKNKDNPETIVYESNIEDEVLAQTYGVVLYIDQIVEIIHRYSGIPKDISAKIAIYIRKIMKRELSIWKSVFVVGTQKKGFTEIFAEASWACIIIDGKTTTYRYKAEGEAMKTYVCYWLKAYYPNEYEEALIPVIDSTL